MSPVTIGSLLFIFLWLMGFALEPENSSSNYKFVGIYPIFFYLGGFTAIGKSKVSYLNIIEQKERKFLCSTTDLAIIFCLLIAFFVMSVRLPQFIFGILQGYNLRQLEYTVRFGGGVGSVFLQISPLLIFHLLIRKTLKKKVHIMLAFLGVSLAICVPVKTHVINMVILLAFYGYLQRPNMIKFIFGRGAIVILLIVFALMATSFLRGETEDLLIEIILLKLRQYTTFNVGNLAYDMEFSQGLTFGRHTFSQLNDLFQIIFFGERGIDRSLSNGGLNSVIDGRFLHRLSPGTNMATAVQVFIWDFGIAFSLIACFLYGFVLNRIAFWAIKRRLPVLLGWSFLCSVFFFWDFDLFEMRYIGSVLVISSATILSIWMPYKKRKSFNLG